MLELLESTISKEFVPALLSVHQLVDIARDILALLRCHDAFMELVSCVAQFASPLHVTRTMVNLKEVRRAPRLADECHAKHTVISTGLYRPVELSIWRQRRVPPIGSHVDPLNGMLHKSAFRDVVFIRYGWTPPHFPQSWVCHCGATFGVPHLSCWRVSVPSP